MYCSHCYREAGAKKEDELNTIEAKAMLEEISKAGFKIMIFSGGEPMMREDIVELVAYAKKLGLRPVFGTNGTLITPQLARELKQAGTMGVGISLDSLDPAKHDNLRQFEGAWEGAVRGMRYCKEAGLGFQIHTTVFDWNRDEVTRITDFAAELGAQAHHIFFLVPTGRAVNIEEESLRAEQYEELITEIMKKQQQVDIEIKPTCAPQFMRIGKQLGMELRFGRGCLAGISYCIVGPTGDVQPCAYLNIAAGNVKETPFTTIWQESEIFKNLRTLDYKGDCGTCGYRQVCGGCRARAYYYHDGDYMGEEPWCLYHGRRGS